MVNNLNKTAYHVLSLFTFRGHTCICARWTICQHRPRQLVHTGRQNSVEASGRGGFCGHRGGVWSGHWHGEILQHQVQIQWWVGKCSVLCMVVLYCMLMVLAYTSVYIHILIIKMYCVRIKISTRTGIAYITVLHV